MIEAGPSRPQAEEILVIKDEIAERWNCLPPEHQASMALTLSSNVIDGEYGPWLLTAIALLHPEIDVPLPLSDEHLRQVGFSDEELRQLNEADRQTAALYRCCVFHNTPRTSRLHYIGLQEIQSSKGHCALFSGSPIFLRILLQMPSQAECQQGRRCPVQYLSQEDQLLNRLCPEEAQTALF